MCAHTETGLFRHPFPGGFHIASHCLQCGENLRGPGQWLKRSEIGQSPETLPVWEEPSSKEQQRGLFD